MSGDNAANTAKVQDYALCLPTKRMGRPRTSPIMLLPCHEIAEVRRLPPPLHQKTAPVVHLSHSSTPKRTKKPPCAQQESQCAQRLKERIARKGGLRNLSPLPIQFEYFIVTSLAVRIFVVSVPSGITLTAKQGKAMQIHLIPHQDLLRDLFYFYLLVKCCLSLSLPRVSYTLLKSLQCK